jgi:predicted N-acetyltransferase YhbS
MITFRHERPADAAAREALLDAAYGPVRFTKPSQRLREGRTPALALVAVDGERIVGTVRLWPVDAGHDRPALLLGPLAVAPDCRRRGIGSALVARALAQARRRRHAAVLLVGDLAFYGRHGFSADKTAGLWMPGPYEPHRLLGLELKPGALDGAHGLIAAARPAKARSRLSALVARVGKSAAVPQPA